MSSNQLFLYHLKKKVVQNTNQISNRMEKKHLDDQKNSMAFVYCVRLFGTKQNLPLTTQVISK